MFERGKKKKKKHMHLNGAMYQPGTKMGYHSFTKGLNGSI